MGAIVKQRRLAETQQRKGTKDTGNTIESMANRKTAALAADLNRIMYETRTGTEMKNQHQTITGKTAMPVTAEHLMRSQTTDASKSAHSLHNAEMMYKSVKGAGDVDKIRREVITDDRKPVSREELTLLSKTGRATAATGTRKGASDASVNGKSLKTVTFRKPSSAISNRSAYNAAANTEKFASKQDQTLFGKSSNKTYRTHTTNDTITEDQFSNNYEQSLSIAPMGRDKHSVRRLAETSHATDDIVSQS